MMFPEPIGYLISWDEGQYISGSACPNWAMQTAAGKTFWNNICFYKNFIIQQHYVLTNYFSHYRAIESNASNTRRAWGRNLHAILREL